MKRWILAGMVGVIALTLASVSFAGDRAKGRWEGVAIGLGVVTVYNLLEHGVLSPVIPSHPACEKHVYYHSPVVYRTHVYRRPPLGRERLGHWEICRERIPKKPIHLHGDRSHGIKYFRIPPGHLPPPGECRVWYRGVSPGHQPPPSNHHYRHKPWRKHPGSHFKRTKNRPY
jgi:hypothetical protein